jgi:hypothetical protein
LVSFDHPGREAEVGIKDVGICDEVIIYFTLTSGLRASSATTST